MPGIDAHTHVFAPEQIAARGALASSDPTFADIYRDAAAKMATAPDLLATLAEANLDAAVAAGFAWSSQSSVELHNDYLLEQARTSGGRLIALATVNLALSGWEQGATRAIDLGAAGFGELRPHNQGTQSAGKPVASAVLPATPAWSFSGTAARP